jgi:hypothetical protein
MATSPIVFLSQPSPITPFLFFTMASSSSASSVISYESESSREPTPEYDPIAAYEARAPLHWDEEEWDFRYQSEDDESLTDGEDLALLLGAELEEDEDDASWGEDLSSSEERADSFSSEEDPMAGTFLLGRQRQRQRHRRQWPKHCSITQAPQDLRRVLVVDCSVLIRPSLGAVISSFVFAVSLLIEFSFVLATLLRRNHLSQEPMATHRLQNIPIRI